VVEPDQQVALLIIETVPRRNAPDRSALVVDLDERRHEGRCCKIGPVFRRRAGRQRHILLGGEAAQCPFGRILDQPTETTDLVIIVPGQGFRRRVLAPQPLQRERQQRQRILLWRVLH
jgi:hypothetical protein